MSIRPIRHLAGCKDIVGHGALSCWAFEPDQKSRQGLRGSCYDFAGQQLSHQGIVIADSCLSPSVHMQSAVELDPGMLIPMLWKLTARTP